MFGGNITGRTGSSPPSRGVSPPFNIPFNYMRGTRVQEETPFELFQRAINGTSELEKKELSQKIFPLLHREVVEDELQKLKSQEKTIGKLTRKVKEFWHFAFVDEENEEAPPSPILSENISMPIQLPKKALPTLVQLTFDESGQKALFEDCEVVKEKCNRFVSIILRQVNYLEQASAYVVDAPSDIRKEAIESAKLQLQDMSTLQANHNRGIDLLENLSKIENDLSEKKREFTQACVSADSYLQTLLKDLEQIFYSAAAEHQKLKETKQFGDITPSTKAWDKMGRKITIDAVNELKTESLPLPCSQTELEHFLLSFHLGHILKNVTGASLFSQLDQHKTKTAEERRKLQKDPNVARSPVNLTSAYEGHYKTGQKIVKDALQLRADFQKLAKDCEEKYSINEKLLQERKAHIIATQMRLEAKYKTLDQILKLGTTKDMLSIANQQVVRYPLQKQEVEPKK